MSCVNYTSIFFYRVVIIFLYYSTGWQAYVR
ncbi:unnamed protein product [Aphis gossypii]|uniref:Uncharacterized protein n=1 Tax=Aphis gossypii TaxID=80765 RepID=A0A9P0J512_APHGO|nr:unnamed protein product [Aphis gossypii]